MPPKRTYLQSPDPIKEQKLETTPDDEAAFADMLGSSMLPPAECGNLSGCSDAVSPPRAAASACSEVLMAASHTPPRSDSVSSAAGTASPMQSPAGKPASPTSPGHNRANFMKKFVTARTYCNLELCRAPAGTKVVLAGVVVAVYPASSNPDRRYIQLADFTGSVGITVWNDNVNLFGFDSVGKVVECCKVVIATHNGKKTLTMARDSVIMFHCNEDHHMAKWWRELLAVPPTPLSSIQSIADNTIINIAGVLGFVSEEKKMVGNAQKTLTSLHIGDTSGSLDVRSWNHPAQTFKKHVEVPVLIQRIRITSFAGTKIGELLDGHGSVVVTEFAGKKQLEDYWAE